jgi:hypothetical protein
MFCTLLSDALDCGIVSLDQMKAGKKMPAGALMRMVTPSNPPAAQHNAASSGPSRGAGPPRQRLAPTAVKQLERNSRFTASTATSTQPGTPCLPRPLDGASLRSLQ